MKKVTILIATFNSMAVIGKTIAAIERQDYPRNMIEILIVDGGSTDGTIEFAKQHGCRVIDNPMTEPVNAKLIGQREAGGDYILFVDHDEVMESKCSIRKKAWLLENYSDCHVVLGSGYKRPKDYPWINQYISEYGDPFSLFLYDFPKGAGCFERLLKRNYKICKETKDYVIFDFGGSSRQAIIELCCLGTMIDKTYFSKIPNAFDKGSVMTHLFYIMLEKGDTMVAFSKKDSLLHYSADSIKAYFPKLKWRIVNNVHFKDMADSGVLGRIKHQKGMNLKKYLYLPYALFVLPATFHGIVLAIDRMNPAFLLHPVFSFYVAVEILIQYGRKLLGIPPVMKSYDGKKEIKR